MRNWSWLGLVGFAMLSACDQDNSGNVPPAGSCAQDIKDIRQEVATAFQNGDIDQPVLDRLGPELDQVQKVCDCGDERNARVLLMQVAFDEQLGADEAYSRKVRQKDDQK